MIMQMFSRFLDQYSSSLARVGFGWDLGRPAFVIASIGVDGKCPSRHH